MGLVWLKAVATTLEPPPLTSSALRRRSREPYGVEFTPSPTLHNVMLCLSTSLKNSRLSSCHKRRGLSFFRIVQVFGKIDTKQR